MERNLLIETSLKNHISNSVKAFNKQPFLTIVEHEIKNSKHVKWSAAPGIDIEQIKEEQGQNLRALKNDKELHLKLGKLLISLPNPKDESLQRTIKEELLEVVANTKANREENEHQNFNLMFFIHNFDNRASLAAYEDLEYNFKILSGHEYLKYDYQIGFNSMNPVIDYNQFLEPYANLLEELGEDKVDMINEAFSAGEYLEEIKKLYLLNAYLGLHYCFDLNRNEIRNVDTVNQKEIFVFANEHDCEQLNIYAL